jgi:glutamate dehydrogenase
VRTDAGEPRLGDLLVAQLRARYRNTDLDAVEGLLDTYYDHVGPEDLAERAAEDHYGAALSHYRVGRRRRPTDTELRVYAPVIDEDGWQTPHSVVDIVADDLPFLVDSAVMAVEAAGCAVHFLAHPVLEVWRDPAGRITAVAGHGDTSTTKSTEAFIHIEFDRVTDPERLDELERSIRAALDDVRVAVDDWGAMRQQMGTLVDELAQPCVAGAEEERREARAFLEWLLDDRFTFLGYREYRLVEDREILSVEETGLGILRGAPPSRRRVDDLPPAGAALVRRPVVLNLTKANAISTVHRPVRMDYVGVKELDDGGAVVGERRFLGLYTSAAYHDTVAEVPVIRTKAAEVMASVGHADSAHDKSTVVTILEGYPRDELFQISVEDLARITESILHLRERRRVRLLVHPDQYGRFISCLVFVPRDRYSTDIRLQIQDLLVQAFDGTGCSFDSQVSGSVLARLHIQVFTRTTADQHVDIAALEGRIAAITHDWEDDLRSSLIDGFGEDEGLRRYESYGGAFPAAYRHDHRAAVARSDIVRLEALEGDAISLNLYRPLEAGEHVHRLKIFRAGTPIALTAILPILHDFGVTVMDERPYEIQARGGRRAWIYDFGLVMPTGIDSVGAGESFEDAFRAVWTGRAESDGFNQLVLTGGLSWRDVAVLRAYRRYLRQIGSTFSQSYYEETLRTHVDVVRLIVEHFRIRFDPDLPGDRSAQRAHVKAEIEQAIDHVPGLDEDRMLRSFATLVEATVRTNHYQLDEQGRPKAELALKLDPSRVPDVPRPRPAHEIFVYSPTVEGVHLRAGRVARGGIRWSDRREDFRTEILGLMKAQAGKNAVIVPVGAKGGFVCKRLSTVDGPEAQRQAVIGCYRGFISGLLDVTDNLVGGSVVHPERVVTHDDDDPYLVVAADKGTATFSDIANELSLRRRFWLRDAFASGGSRGYDHKAMGITARGAWESVRRHFRELGVEVDAEPVTVAGIGDMSGDVFGNGVLMSPTLRLVAAYNHLHVFVDPDPDPVTGHAERRRLYELPGSTWADYDPSLISAGGGVYPRATKAVPVGPELRAALGLADDVDELTPDQLIRGILVAPVDLLWNGGIGTYVRASAETNADVGDRANDAVRVSAADLRCRVIGEGGNLGLTQRARVEFARSGGRVYSDAIDNSAGVNCSDYEVNIKILLDGVVADGDLTTKQRDRLLAEMTAEVADLVLVENYRQTQALAVAGMQAPGMVDVHKRHLRWLEQVASLDRELEGLPSDDELNERRSDSTGLSAPELAVVMAYTKIAVKAGLLDGELPDDPVGRDLLRAYFPAPIRQRYADRLDGHQLRRELIVTEVTNHLVDRAGLTMTRRLVEETALPLADIARAHLAAWRVFDLDEVWRRIDELDGEVDAVVQLSMHLEAKRLGERATRWLLRNEPVPLDIADLAHRYRPHIQELTRSLPEALRGTDRVGFDQRVEGLRGEGVPEELACRSALQSLLITGLDIGRITSETGQPLMRTAGTYFALDDLLELAWLRNRIVALPRGDRWESMARSALRDDFFHMHAELTREVLTGAPVGSPAQLVERWCARRHHGTAHCLSVLADIRSSGRADLAQLSVALREFRNLLHLAASAAER